MGMIGPNCSSVYNFILGWMGYSMAGIINVLLLPPKIVPPFVLTIDAPFLTASSIRALRNWIRLGLGNGVTWEYVIPFFFLVEVWFCHGKPMFKDSTALDNFCTNKSACIFGTKNIFNAVQRCPLNERLPSNDSVIIFLKIVVPFCSVTPWNISGNTIAAFLAPNCKNVFNRCGWVWYCINWSALLEDPIMAKPWISPVCNIAGNTFAPDPAMKLTVPWGTCLAKASNVNKWANPPTAGILTIQIFPNNSAGINVA